MKIFVINLAGQEARWAAVRRQFHAAGVEPSRYEAVDPRSLPARELQRLYSAALNREQYHKPLQPGEIGCYASHIALWRQLLESDEQLMAVFEDDVDVDVDLAPLLRALERAPADWDLVKLIGRPRERPRARIARVGTRELIAYRRIPGLTCAYVIDRRGAEKLLAQRVPFGRPIDIDLRHWWECDLRILGLWPYPAHPAPSSLLSTIEGRRTAVDARTRWRKTLLQVRYSLLNWHATQAGARPAVPHGARVRPLAGPAVR